MSNNELIARLLGLFPANKTSYGVFMPNGNMMTESPSSPPDMTELMTKHVMGVQGLGLVPIQNDSTAKWGAIDLDAHGDAPDVDLVALEAEIRKLDLPLMVCRSKSGGAHLYIFLTEPMPAKDLRNVLRGYLAQLGLPAATEIFPKQDTLQMGQRGNWINLCYFNASDTIRYCVEAGKQVKLEYFVELAESRRVEPRTLTEQSLGGHAEAPPCIQRMLRDGVDKGGRNICLFHFAVYARQAFKDTWESQVEEFNNKAFTKPLRRAEVNKVITSAAGSGYKYKCNDEYIKTLCDSGLCVKRDFGIPKSELDGLERFEHPEYGPLQRMDNSDPVVWILNIAGKPIQCRSTDLLSHKSVRLAVTEQLHFAVPPMKENQWYPIYATLMDEHQVVEAAPELSIGHSVMAKVTDFVRNANPTDPRIDPEERWQLDNGASCIQEVNGDLVAMFRGQDILEYLKNMRVSGVDPAKLSSVLKEHGAENKNVRLPKTDHNNGKQVRAWVIPLSKVWDGEPDDIKIETEL